MSHVFDSPIATILLIAGLAGFFGLSVWLSVVDWREHRLPNTLVGASAALGLVTLSAVSALTADTASLFRALMAAVACFSTYLALHLISARGLGAGDVKLAAVIGLFLGWFGWSMVIAGIVAGFALGALFSLGILAFRRGNRRSKVAFGPWMLAGAWLAMGLQAGAVLAA